MKFICLLKRNIEVQLYFLQIAHKSGGDSIERERESSGLSGFESAIYVT